MTNKEFVEKLKKIATSYNTLYVMGCFGAPLTGSNVSRYCNNHEYNKRAERTKMIKAVADKNPPYYGFDCVCLIKGVLWGWNGDASKTYGGAGYAVNGVPDIGADTMITKCSGISTDFSKIEIGEAVWLSGHIGVYIGDGLAVECTPAFENKVQITAVKNIGTKSGYNSRTWTKHGKLPYIEYVEAAAETPAPAATTTAAIKAGDLVKITGTKYYSGKTIPDWVKAKNWYVSEVNGSRVVIDKSEDGKNSICSPVNAADLQVVSGTAKTVDELAREVIAGKWGNGTDRKNRLTAAGYDYSAVQKRVNELLK